MPEFTSSLLKIEGTQASMVALFGKSASAVNADGSARQRSTAVKLEGEKKRKNRSRRSRHRREKAEEIQKYGFACTNPLDLL